MWRSSVNEMAMTSSGSRSLFLESCQTVHSLFLFSMVSMWFLKHNISSIGKRPYILEWLQKNALKVSCFGHWERIMRFKPGISWFIAQSLCHYRRSRVGPCWNEVPFYAKHSPLSMIIWGYRKRKKMPFWGGQLQCYVPNDSLSLITSERGRLCQV